MTPRSTTMLAASGVLLALSSCRTTTDQSVRSGETIAPPMVVDDSIDSNWDYLRQKYDTDGDGAITSAEYTRSETAFGRLDRNGDGTISDTDFQRGGGMNREQSRARSRGRRFLARYFQGEGDAGSLERAELTAAFTAFDTSKDGTIDEEEFKCAAEQVKQDLPGDDSRMVARSMGDVEPWDGLVAAIDTNEDSKLSSEEALAFFDANDREGVLSFSASNSNAGANNRARAERPESGAAEGTVAPDFTLTDLDGANPATLSSFKGDKPVALVFGSYT